MPAMETVQLSIANTNYAKALEETLKRNGAWEVRCVELPDPRIDGVLVVDSEAFERLPSSLPNPERVVLITRNDPAHLSLAWEAGIVSVVFENDPINTAVLAILAARLRLIELRKGSSPPAQPVPGRPPGPPRARGK
jgi:hypothetical protein